MVKRVTSRAKTQRFDCHNCGVTSSYSIRDVAVHPSWVDVVYARMMQTDPKLNNGDATIPQRMATMDKARKYVVDILDKAGLHEGISPAQDRERTAALGPLLYVTCAAAKCKVPHFLDHRDTPSPEMLRKYVHNQMPNKRVKNRNYGYLDISLEPQWSLGQEQEVEENERPPMDPHAHKYITPMEPEDEEKLYKAAKRAERLTQRPVERKPDGTYGEVRNTPYVPVAEREAINGYVDAEIVSDNEDEDIYDPMDILSPEERRIAEEEAAKINAMLDNA